MGERTGEAAAGGISEQDYEIVGMRLMLRDLLAVSYDAIRATAISRGREYCGTEHTSPRRKNLQGPEIGPDTLFPDPYDGY